MDKPIQIKIGNIVLKIISTFLPVKNRVLFIGSIKNKLFDNSQIIYDNLDHDKKIITWNLPHGIFDLIKLSYFIMTSRVIIIDNINIYFAYIRLKKQQKLIHVGHGGCWPTKKIGMDRSSYNIHEEFCNDQYDDFIVASDEVCKLYMSAYNIKEEAFTKIGFPITDLLIHNQKKYEKEFYEKYPDLINKNIIIYVPTFRLTSDATNVLEGYDYEIDWDDLDNQLARTNSVFLIKRHPVMIQYNIKIINKEYENIIDIGDISNNSLFVASDLLITDYSSIFNEYLLLNKPIIFYCPDLEEYSKVVGLYDKIPDDLPGTFCQNYSELLYSINNPEKNVDYSYHKEKIVKYCDGNSTKNLLKIINEYLE